MQEFLKWYKIVFKQPFGFQLGVSSPHFQNNFLARFAYEIFGDSWGGLSNGFSVHFCSASQYMVSIGLMWEVDLLKREIGYTLIRL